MCILFYPILFVQISNYLLVHISSYLLCTYIQLSCLYTHLSNLFVYRSSYLISTCQATIYMLKKGYPVQEQVRLSCLYVWLFCQYTLPGILSVYRPILSVNSSGYPLWSCPTDRSHYHPLYLGQAILIYIQLGLLIIHHYTMHIYTNILITALDFWTFALKGLLLYKCHLARLYL